MTKSYRFLGTESQVGTLQLDTFGQKADLSEDVAISAIKGKCPLIPEEDFLKIFADPAQTAKELEQYAKITSHAEASQSFLERKRLCLTLFHDLRTSLVEAFKPVEPMAEEKLNQIIAALPAEDAAEGEV